MGAPVGSILFLLFLGRQEAGLPVGSPGFPGPSSPGRQTPDKSLWAPQLPTGALLWGLSWPTACRDLGDLGRGCPSRGWAGSAGSSGCLPLLTGSTSRGPGATVHTCACVSVHMSTQSKAHTQRMQTLTHGYSQTPIFHTCTHSHIHI